MIQIAESYSGGLNMKKFLSLITALIMTLSLMTVQASAASPKLNKSKVNLPIGYHVTLKVSNASSSVKWTVGDSSIAAIKSNGDYSIKVSGKKAGSTYVYAQIGKKNLKCKITVRKSFISTSSSTVKLAAGKSKTVTIAVKGDKSVAYEVSNPNVCSVKWGKSWDGDKIKLTIKAKKDGSAKVMVYNKNARKTTAKTISVYVDSSAASQSAKTEKQNVIIFGGTDTSKANTAPDPSEMVSQVIELVNEERVAAGKSKLTASAELNQAAAIRAEEITRTFSHNRPDGSKCFTAINDAGFSYSSAGENIAMGQTDANDVMNSWMNSQGHKSNILGDFTNIGVGCYYYNGYYYWVQMFTK